MAEDLITPENVSKELLKSIFDAALMETSWDSDGDLKVKERINCFVLIPEQKDRIHLFSLFGFEDGVSMGKRLECVNKINDEYIMVRAIAGKNNTLQFDFDIYLRGGVTRKNIVLATKRFLSVPLGAIADHGKDLVQ